MTMELNFSYLHSARIGYGYQGIETHKALTKLGVDVYDGLPGSGDLDIDKKRAKICKDVLFLTVPTHVKGWWEGQRPHIFTMYETNDLPEGMRDQLHNFETILTPSQACVDMFSKYHDNVKYVPLGVDGERWHFQERNKGDVFFNFLIAGSGYRKGNDLAHKAFLKVFGGRKFSGGPIPRLLMKSPKSEQYEGENVEVFGGYMSPQDEVALYASAHCYLQPSRGEGWGMQPMQAMAQGLPTILSDAHGHVPFAEYGVPISCELSPAKYMSDFFGESGNWWEPNFDELCEAMVAVYENYDEHIARATVNSELVRTTFTWEKSAEAIIEALNGTKRFTERLEDVREVWVSPNQKRFKVITIRDWRTDIGGVVSYFAKGKTYYELADVKRVMFESGVLDPACISAEDGLSEQQLNRIEEYKRQHSCCPTCGQEVSQELEDAVCI